MDFDNDNILSIEQIKSKIYDFLTVDDYYPINKIILFGSYAKGSAEANSDIDLYICDSPEFGGLKNFALIGDLKNIFLKEIEVFIDRNVDKESEFYNNILKEGIVIYEQ